MGKPTDRANSVQLKARAREAAVLIFSRHGFEGTSVQAIADEVGVSKQTLLYHFESKEGLRDAVLDEMVDVWRAALPQLLAVLTRPDAPFEDALTDVMAFFREKPAHCRFLLQELLRTAAGDEPLAPIEPWLKVGAEFIRRAQTEGRVAADVDAEAWLVNVGTMILSTLSLLDERRPGPRPDAVIREMARIMGSSLGGRRPTGA